MHSLSNLETKLRTSMVEMGKLLHDKDLVGACSGNMSIKLPGELFLVTPTASHLGFLKEEELAVVDIEGNAIEGKPSSEIAMHLELYRNCEEAGAIIHSHPHVATAWSIAQPNLETLPMNVISEAILCAGNIPIVPYAEPGTPMMGTNLVPFLPDNKIMILSQHGAICWGDDLFEAFLGTERLEHLAKTLMYGHLLGGLTPLPEEEIEKLRAMRITIGNKIL